jgi:hypothetical protein
MEHIKRLVVVVVVVVVTFRLDKYTNFFFVTYKVYFTSSIFIHFADTSLARSL